jgi:Na+/H+ antiporter NhaD/arsenite permease-like protein
MKIQLNKIVFFLGALLLASTPVMAESEGAHLGLMGQWEGVLSLVVFVVAYVLVISEETIHLRKSKPVMVAAGVIWILVALTYSRIGEAELVQEMVRHGLLEFVELFLFLLAAMTYINTMDERGVFDVLRSWLLAQRYSLRKLFWVTGALAFVMSPVADNLTTALLLSTVVIAVAGQNLRFAVVGCINVVVAANAGGAFSPFGDITTLMVWQAGLVEFTQFFPLIIPSLVNWLVTAALLSLALSSDQPDAIAEDAKLRHGAWVVMALFILTISMAVTTHTLLHLPPVIGMMTGLGLLKLFGYYLQTRGGRFSYSDEPVLNDQALSLEGDPRKTPATSDAQYDIYRNLQQVERPGCIWLSGCWFRFLVWRTWSNHCEHPGGVCVGHL